MHPEPKTLRTLIPLLLCCSCLAHKLKGPAQDHAIQSEVIVQWCEEERYGECPEEVVEATRIMAEQARCIEAITRAERCDK